VGRIDMNEEQQIVWDTIKYGPHKTLVEQIISSRQIGEVSPHLMKSFVRIATAVANKSNFVNYSYKEDMISEAVLSMIKYWDRIQLDKTDHPVAYFAVLAQNACFGIINREKKQQEIKIDFEEYQKIQ